MDSIKATLPIIDLAKASDSVSRKDVAKQLVNAFGTTGFLFIDNAPGVNMEQLHKNTKLFFSMSKEEKNNVAKNKWNQQNKNIYRGYFPVEDNETSYKEGFEIGIGDRQFDDPQIHPLFKESNMWPDQLENPADFQTDMQEYFTAMVNTGTEILRLLTLGSGVEEDWFEAMFLPDTLSTLRLLHYPQRPLPPDTPRNDQRVELACSEHSDSGFVTLLSTFDYPGLQILTDDNSWMDVAPRPNSLVVNIGDVLSKLSNGRFKATKHRVVDTKQDRFSVPFFFEPRYDSEIDRLLPLENTRNIDHSYQYGITSGTKYGPWLISKMQQFAEYKDILQISN